MHTPANGDLNVFFLKQISLNNSEDALQSRVLAARKLLSDDAQQTLMHHLLDQIKEKHAISLDYLDLTSEMQG